MARRAHHPDAFHRGQVEAMAGFGVPEADVARVPSVDPRTLVDGPVKIELSWLDSKL